MIETLDHRGITFYPINGQTKPLHPEHTMKFTKHALLSCVLLVGLSSASIAKPKKAAAPRGIDPASLKLNTQAEPDLKQDGFVELFNGKDLSGWVVKGGIMPFVVRDGEIIGTCDPEMRLNSFLSTEKSYSDFIFTTAFKWDELSNSGVMFRADTRPLDDKEMPALKDRSLQRVLGYQCEIDTSPRAWTGGIYGEAMGAWKYPLSKEEEHADARAAVKNPKGWNRLTIYAKGDKMMTWINGVPCANLSGDERESGFIGLQIHQGKKGQIRWKNIRIKDLSGK